MAKKEANEIAPAGAAESTGAPKPSALRCGKAVASLILVLFAYVSVIAGLIFESTTLSVLIAFIWLAPILGVFGVVFGHRARRQIRRSGGLLAGKGMATTGMMLGYVGLGLWLLLFITTNGFVPGLVRSRVAANQASAVGSLRTINTAAITYDSTYNQGFPLSLAVLAPPKTEGTSSNPQPDEHEAGLIDDILASGIKAGYRFTYIPGKPDEKGAIQTYFIRANPTEPGVTGKMYYYTDQSGVIREEEGKEANEYSKAIAG